MNLISNAVKFTTYNGNVTISSKIITDPSSLSIKHVDFVKIM